MAVAAVAAMVVAAVGAAAVGGVPLYKTPGAPVDARVDDLVRRMTLEEKVQQLVLPFGAKFPADYAKAGYNTTGLGATYPLHALPGEQWWETRNNWQRNAVENSRLGIPTSFIYERRCQLYCWPQYVPPGSIVNGSAALVSIVLVMVAHQLPLWWIGW